MDKQGILSWPNPSPETVLFFSGKVEPPHSSHEDLTDDLSTRSFCHPEVEEEVWSALMELAWLLSFRVSLWPWEEERVRAFQQLLLST